MKLIEYFKNVRWNYNRPENGQASDWTSFSLIVAEDDKNNLFWGPTWGYEKDWEKKKLYPAPLVERPYDLLFMEDQAPWISK